MNRKLELLIHRTARIVDQKFRQDEGLHPFFYARTDKGKRIIIDPFSLGVIPKDTEMTGMVKDAISNCAQMAFAMYKVKRYVYASEAWMLSTTEGGEEKEALEIARILAAGGDLSNHPKRIEIINYEAEDIAGNAISARQSIVRPAGSPPYLFDDLTLEDTTHHELSGRFTHLLDFRKHLDTVRNT